MSSVNALGRRKTSVARVYLTEGKGNFIINGRDVKEYVPLAIHQYKLNRPFDLTETKGKYDRLITSNICS